MKKLFVLLTLLLLLTGCGNTEPVIEESDGYAELLSAYETQEVMLKTSVVLAEAFMNQRNTVIAANATWAYKPTYTPYPTQIPTDTPTATPDYDFCTDNGGVWIEAIANTKMYTAILDENGKVKTISGGIIKVEVVPKNTHTGLTIGDKVCGWEKVKVTVIGFLIPNC